MQLQFNSDWRNKFKCLLCASNTQWRITIPIFDELHLGGRVQLVNKNSMINVINAASQVRTRHRGDRVFSKGVLRRNGGNFLKEGPKKQKSNLGRAGQRNHKWFGNAGEKCLLWWSTGVGMRLESYFHARCQHDTTHVSVRLPSQVWKLSSPTLQATWKPTPKIW